MRAQYTFPAFATFSLLMVVYKIQIWSKLKIQKYLKVLFHSSSTNYVRAGVRTAVLVVFIWLPMIRVLLACGSLRGPRILVCLGKLLCKPRQLTAISSCCFSQGTRGLGAPTHLDAAINIRCRAIASVDVSGEFYGLKLCTLNTLDGNVRTVWYSL